MGSSGEVGFADYMENVHREWLGSSVDFAEIINPSLVSIMSSILTIPEASPGQQTNPYMIKSAYLVDNDMQVITNAYNDLISSGGYLTTRSHTGNRANQAQEDWDNILFHVQDKIDNPNITLSPVDISALVQTLVTSNIANATALALQVVIDSKSNADVIVTGAIDKALAVLNSQAVADSISVFSDNLLTEVNKTKSRFSAGMVDINAVMSSAFIFGNSNIEAQAVRSIAEFTNGLISALYNQVILAYIQMATNLSAQEVNGFNNIFVNNLRGQATSELQVRQVRDDRINQGTNLMSSMLFGNISNDLSRVTAAQNAYNTKAANFFIKDQEDLRISVEGLLWDMKVYQHGANVLGALNTGGGTFIPEGASQTSLSVAGGLAGGLAGATIGGTIGSVVPGVGTAVGAGIGAVIGLIGGIFAGAIA